MMQGNTYVMSDLHGCYDEYIKMLELINFNKKDKLYILGDIIDRGTKPIEIIMDILERDNVTALLGNHEFYAREVLMYVNSYIDEISEEFYDKSIREKYFIWQYNGGETTFDEYYRLSIKEQKQIVNFLSNLPTYIDLEVCGKKFVLMHAGIDKYMTDDERKFLKLEDFILNSPTNFSTPFFQKEKSRFLIFGHVPTFRLHNYDADAEPGKIFIKNNYIDIDCGAVYPNYGGRMGCLCLNDMKEFYI